MAADAKATGDAIHNLQGLVGTPLTAATAASMTNTDKIYVYTGSETGYTNGNWYYYDGTAWASGGVYNSIAMNMDTVPTLGSSKPVTSGGIKAALDLMDDDISSLNEDITNLQTNKQDALTFDQTPTDESTNPVTSVGIKNAIEAAVDVKAPGIYETASGSVANFTDGADNMPIKSCVVNIEPIQEGEGDPSPDNVRPISGRTGLSVSRCGKNLLWKAIQSSTMNGITWTLNDDGSITASGTSTGRSYIRIIISARDAYTLPNGTYTYSLTPTGSDYTNIYSLIGAYKGNKYYKNVCAVGSSNNFAKVFEWNDSDLTAVLDIAIEIAQANKTVNCTVYPQIELGSTATDYEPYQGDTYSVNWETEAGTVYGGTLDIVSGKLVVDSVLLSFDGTEAWNLISSNTYLALWNNPPSISNDDLNQISNYLIGGGADYPKFGKYRAQINGAIVIGNAINSQAPYSYKWGTAQEFKAYLAEHPLQVCYKIATPTEIQLTPQEVRTLLGVNNVWSDGGDMAVEYPADTKLYIDQKITEAIAAAMA